MSFLLSRRRVLVSALGTGILAAIPSTVGGCADDSPARARKTIRKTLHLGASALKAAPLSRATRVEVRIGARRFPAAAHTAATRREHATRVAKAGQPSTAALTHFAVGVIFSAEAPQSYSAFAIMPDGREILVCAGIHVASRADRDRAAALGEGGAASTDDPAEIMDDDDASIWAVFNNPHVMSHDLATAARVIEAIQGCPDYKTLRAAISAFPEAREPEAAGYAGWVYGRYRTYKNQAGQTVYVTSVDWNGNTILDANGKPQRVIDWELSPYAYPSLGMPQSVKELAGVVTDQLTEAFNNLPSEYEGVKYFRADPVTARSDVDLVGRAARRNGLGDVVESFTFSAQERTQEHRTLQVEPVAGASSSFRVKLDNLLALGSMYGVSHFDDKGDHIQTNVLGYVGSTYYPSLTLARGWHSSGEAEFERPARSFSSNVWTCSPAMHHGDYGPGGHQVNFTGRALVTWAMSILADIMIPGIFLSMGLIEARGAGEKIVEETILEAIKSGTLDAVIDAAFAGITAIYGAVAGQNVASLLGDMSLDFVKIIVRLAEKLFLQGTFAAIVAGQLAQAGVETTLATATPIVGWAFYAAEIALTGSQLVVSSAHLIGSTIFTSGVLRYTHPLTVKAYPKDSSYFISSARYYKLAVSPSPDPNGKSAAFTPIVKTGAIVIQRDAKGREFFEMELETVPIATPLYVQVTLFDAPSEGRANVVGKFAVGQVPNGGKPGVAQEFEAEVTIKPLPVDEGMGLAHDVVLKPSAGAWMWSAKDSPAPASDLDPFQCVQGSLCGLTTLTVRQTEDKPGHIAWGYRTSCSLGTSPIMADVAMAKSVADFPENVPVSESVCVRGGTRMFLYGLSGTRVVLSQTEVERARIYLLKEADPEVDLRSWNDTATPYATSRGGLVVSARVAPDGRRLFLGFEDGVEVIDLMQDELSTSMRASTIISRPGFMPGCISACTAVAGFHHGDQLAVLDVGNYRVSAFDYDGAFVHHFDTPDGFLQLDRSGGNHVLLDLDVDAAGNVWVLSQRVQVSARPVPSLSIYGTNGKRLVELSSVAAERFALDRFNQVFSLNRQAIMGASGYASPTVSRWYPTHKDS